MKVVLLLTLVSLFACEAVSFGEVMRRQFSDASLSPVSRVVELLQGLAKQVEKEGKDEEALYENYVCWAQSVISQKEAYNSAAASEIDSLETYISDLEAGRIELTSERADLEKDIETLMADLEAAKHMREKEKADFEEASAEMNAALSALDDAIGVLEEATKDHKEGTFLAVKSRVESRVARGGVRAIAQEAKNLERAVELGQKFLTSADSLFLKRVLEGDVPTWDWKKLNRKATFKMSYKGRSFKIQSVLAKLHTTFSINLKEATEKEEAAVAEYEKLKEAKGEQLTASQDALAAMESEGGHRGLAKDEAKEKLGLLKQQMENDKAIIKDTKASLEAKKGEWKERLSLRAGEIEAINKAIAILHSDDARDLFKKSFASQGYLFIQEAMAMTDHGSRRARAIDVLRQTIKSVPDSRLIPVMNLVRGLRGHKEFPGDEFDGDMPEFEGEDDWDLSELEDESGAPAGKSDEPAEEYKSVKSMFKPVLIAIDKMIETLKGDEAEDLKKKESCDKERMADTRDAISNSRAMDEMTDKITKLTEEIKELEKKIEEAKAQKEAVEKELKEATENRAAELKEFKLNLKDDEDAAALVAQATDVLKSFYSENGLMLVQKHAKQPAVTVAGEAPPPPPPTWEAPYGGKTGENTGIIANLEMVKEDIEKDIHESKDAEAKAVAEYEAFKKESEDQIEALKKDMEDMAATVGRKLEDKTSTIEGRTISAGELKTLMDKIADIAPNCEYYTVNYAIREANRHIELDGLLKAKALLMGGKFTKPKDPNREIKPGDAAN